jgi:hypothetical protein
LIVSENDDEVGFGVLRFTVRVGWFTKETYELKTKNEVKQFHGFVKVDWKAGGSVVTEKARIR